MPKKPYAKFVVANKALFYIKNFQYSSFIKLSIIEAELNLLDAYKKKSVFQPKIRSSLLFIREFSKQNHTQLFC